MLDLGASATVAMPTTASPRPDRPVHGPAANIWPKLRETGECAEQDDLHAAASADDTAAKRADSAIRRTGPQQGSRYVIGSGCCRLRRIAPSERLLTQWWASWQRASSEPSSEAV